MAFRSRPYPWLLTLIGCLVAGSLSPASAATNAAIGGIRGLDNGTLSGGDGTGSAQITINAVDLSLVKQARSLSGVVLPDSAVVRPGQEIYFVLYVDNVADHVASDVRMQDALDESQFTYVPGSIAMTTVATGAGDAAIWAGFWIPLTDGVGGPDDQASIVDSGGAPGPDRLTVGQEAVQPNFPLSVPGGSLTAIRFRVRVN